MPPLMPAAKFRPTAQNYSTAPVIYSQQWSPAPSITATAPEFLTQKRSPALPFINTSPLVAPYKSVLPTIILSSGLRS